MKWNVAAGILLLPVIAIAIWYVAAPQKIPHGPKPEMFQHDGNIVKNNPGQEPDTWYLIYEIPGAPAVSQPLEFNGGSRCGSADMLKICNISFEQGARVHIEGFRLKDTVVVTKLIYEQ